MAPNDELLPLTPRVFLLMWALEGGPQHGYGLLGRVEELGQGQVRIGPASLYEAIQTLRRRGLIRPCDAPEGADRRRRYFRLTSEGQDILRSEAARLARLVEDLKSAGLVDAAAPR
jgi:DNA-binding PadR family transcriptional regulator